MNPGIGTEVVEISQSVDNGLVVVTAEILLNKYTTLQTLDLIQYRTKVRRELKIQLEICRLD